MSSFYVLFQELHDSYLQTLCYLQCTCTFSNECLGSYMSTPNHRPAFSFHQLIRTHSNRLVIGVFLGRLVFALSHIPERGGGKVGFICVESNQQILYAKQDKKRVFASYCGGPQMTCTRGSWNTTDLVV
jgi:hypothetical protein